MASKFLLVGLASDGVQNQVVYPASMAVLDDLFGGTYIQRETITSSTSSIILHYEPLKTPKNTLDGVKNQLFRPQYLDGYYYFGTVGGTGSPILDLEYSPYLAKEDLVCFAKRFADISGEIPYVCRIGGSTASKTINDWQFYALYAGKKYNLVNVAMTSTTLVISGLEPNYSTRTYSASGSGGIDDIKAALDRDYRLGLSPVLVTQVGSALIPGSYSLTGGLDGSLSDSSIADFIDNVSIPPDVSHVIFLRAINQVVMDNLIQYFEQFATQPRMFLFNAPNYSGDIATWAYDQTLDIPNRHDQVGAVLGTIETLYSGKQVTRYAVEGATIGLASKTSRNPTNTPVNALSFTPQLSETELSSTKGFGWMPLMRYIKNDISVYQGVTTANNNTFLYSCKVAELAAIVYNYCSVYYGEILQEGPHARIAQNIKQEITNNIDFVILQDVEVYVKGDSMYVYVDAYLPGEILQITFTIKNK